MRIAEYKKVNGSMRLVYRDMTEEEIKAFKEDLEKRINETTLEEKIEALS